MKSILIGMIQFYRRYISVAIFGSSKCKYYPTCSEYALIVLRKHGALKGSYLAFKRVLRCNPFSKGGYDPPD